MIIFIVYSIIILILIFISFIAFKGISRGLYYKKKNIYKNKKKNLS